MKYIKTFKICLFIGYISIFTWIPYWLMNTYAQKYHLVYTGIYGYGADTPAYLEQMSPAASVGLLHLNFFTNEPHKPVLINSFYVLFGKTFTFFNISLPFGFLLLRIIFGSLILIIFYKIAFLITESKKVAYYSLYFLMFGGGLAQIFINNDIATHFETLPGIRIFAFPHSVLAVTLIWLIVYWLTKIDFSDHKQNIKYSLLIGIFSFIITILVPFYFLIIFGILVLFYFRQLIIESRLIWQQIISLTIILILSSPYLLYLKFIVLKDPVWATKFNQADNLPSTSLLMLVIAFCLYFLFILFDLNVKKIWSDRYKYLSWSWLVSASILAIIRLPGGWRYIEGITLPLSFLATFGLINFFKIKYFYFKYSIIFLTFLLLLLIMVKTAFIHLDNIFDRKLISKDLVNVYSWVKINSDKNTIMVSNADSIIYGPYYAKRKVYVGHWAESYQAEKKYREVQQLFVYGKISYNLNQLINYDKVCFIIDKIKTKKIPSDLSNTKKYTSINFNSIKLICERDAISNHEN